MRNQPWVARPVQSLCSLVACIGFAVPCSALAQERSWEVIASSPEVGELAPLRHEDIAFVNEWTGWIVSPNSVFKTLDGGVTWREQRIHGGRLRSAAFADEATGWVGTLDPTRVLLETHDGGESWHDITSRLSPGIVPGICGLWVVNPQVVVGVGRYAGAAHFIRSDDRGATWLVKDMGSVAGALVDVYFFNENVGVVVGGTSPDRSGSAVILRTTDGGVSWSVQHITTGQREWAWKIFFIDNNVGYVSVESYRRGLILKTEDGGLTWQEIEVPGAFGLQSVGFISGLEGWVGGYGGSFRTVDGGRSWSPEARLGGGINRIRVLRDVMAYAIGSRAFRLPLR